MNLMFYNIFLLSKIPSLLSKQLNWNRADLNGTLSKACLLLNSGILV